MIVAPYRDFPFLAPKTFQEFFATIQRAFTEAGQYPATASGHYEGDYDDVLPASGEQRHDDSADYTGASSLGLSMASISLPLGRVAPLEALEYAAQPNEPHFYWEKPDMGEAIAAVGCVAERQLAGSDRFSQTQQVLEQWFASTAIIGDLDLPFSGPHGFCRFTFFDHDIISAPFPSASVFIPQWHVGKHHHCSTFVANVAARSTVAARSSAKLEGRCLDLWRVYQQLSKRLKSSLSYSAATRSSLRSSSPNHLGPGQSKRGALPSLEDKTEEGSGEWQPEPHVHSLVSARSGDRLSNAGVLTLASQQKQAFKQSVQATLNAIETQDISKAVLAQVLDVEVTSPFQVFPSLHNLCRVYRDCHVFSTANGRGQVFLGASPERLLSIRDRTLYTEAIAGSAPRGATPFEDEQFGNTLLCSLKELHEHQLVVNFITHQLAQLNVEPRRSTFPKLLRLSNIQHLHTPICADLPPDLHALEIVAQLHPTPAVAGVPQDLACNIIQEQESFQRSLYAAPMGWVNYQGDSEFIVGIRSALLSANTSRLYAGAGIVRGSQPDLEVSEIELKLQTLLTTLLY